MRQKAVTRETPSQRIVKDIRRRTRKHHSAKEKFRIVLEGLRGEEGIAELCRPLPRQATSLEVKNLRAEAAALKEAVAGLIVENRLFNKSMNRDGGDGE